MFCSTIIATIDRPSLTNAVLSVVEQDFTEDDFEVIVVNDTGSPLLGYDWQQSHRVQVITTQCRERSVARNAGAAIALGRFLHFLDDDDVLLPGALRAFWELSKQSDAGWLYGAYESMNLAGNITGFYQPVMKGNVFAECVAGEAMSLNISLIRAEGFFKIGGFDPKLVYVEDFDLVRRLSYFEKIAPTSHKVGRRRKGDEGSTTDYTMFASRERQSREKVLSMPDVRSRLEDSARGRVYWRGRVSRIYLASLVHNLRERRLFVALDRLVTWTVLTRYFVFQRAYWRGLLRKM